MLSSVPDEWKLKSIKQQQQKKTLSKNLILNQIRLSNSGV